MDNIFFCSVKSTFIAFLVLTLNSRKLLQQHLFQRYITPTVVLTFLPTTHSTVTSNITTTNDNNVSNLTVCNSGATASNFDMYQQTSIDSNEISIRTLVLDAISTETYRKSLISKLFFQQILSLSTNPFVSFSDFMATVVSHFGINSGSVERETESAALSILNTFFRVSNLQVVPFGNVSGKCIKVPDSHNRIADITYFTFRSIVSAADVDSHAPAKILSLKFSLHLPQSLSDSTHTSIPVITTDGGPPLDTISSKPVVNLVFTLGNLSDDILSGMEVNQMRTLLIDDRDILSPTIAVFIILLQPSNLFSTPPPLTSVVHTILSFSVVLPSIICKLVHIILCRLLRKYC